MPRFIVLAELTDVATRTRTTSLVSAPGHLRAHIKRVSEKVVAPKREVVARESFARVRVRHIFEPPHTNGLLYRAVIAMSWISRHRGDWARAISECVCVLGAFARCGPTDRLITFISSTTVRTWDTSSVTRVQTNRMRRSMLSGYESVLSGGDEVRRLCWRI